MAALAALALVRSLVFASLTPPYQSSDEPWHLDYARVVGQGHLPVTGRTQLDPAIVVHAKQVSSDRHVTLYGITNPPLSREAFQPPLAYIVPGVGYRLLGARGGLLWFRAFDALLGVVLVLVAYGAARRAFPESPWAGPLAGLTVACLPSVAMVTSSASNDAAAGVLALAALAMAAGLARQGGSIRRFAVLGALVGAAGLAKTTGLAAAPPAVVAAVVAPRAHRSAGARSSRPYAIGAVAGAAALVMAPWVARNLWVYGDLTGTKAFVDSYPGSRIGGLSLLLAGRPRLTGAHRFWPELLRSAVGVLRWSDLRLPGWAYALAGAGALAGFAAVAAWLRRAAPVNRRAAAVLLSALPFGVVATAWFALTVDWQPQGRYLIPGMLGAASVVGASCGWRGFAVAGGALLALLGAGIATTARTYGLP